MNDYDIARFSKNDIREFWSMLVDHKTRLTEEFKHESDESQRRFIIGQIEALKTTISQLEKMFALF